MRKLRKFYEFKENDYVATEILNIMEKINYDCQFNSDLERTKLHPLYKDLINYGEKVIPYLIEDIDNSILWFTVLRELTGQDPDKHHRGYMKLMREDWKNWAKENGYTS